jgi:hypothetical protein
MMPMKRFLLSVVLTISSALAATAGDDGWISLFNGKDLAGWKANDPQGTFKVEDGQIIVHGPRSHLFYTGPVMNHDFKNFELKAEIMTKPKANSGVYFHTAWQDGGWPSKGYEIQVNNSHKDPKRTAGIYAVQDNFEAPAKDNEWFTLYIKVVGKHILTQVNGKTVSDYTEPDDVKRPLNMKGRVLSHGTFCIQGHDPDSEVRFRSFMVKPLP